MDFDNTIKELLNERLAKLEQFFDADVVFFYGAIDLGIQRIFRDFIEELKNSNDAHQRLVMLVNSPGGSVETVEKMVEVMRHHYGEVSFVVPDYAFSAGTVLCLSGDRLYMDYSSSLGPIDPQVWNGKQFVPALGYLDKVNEMIDKSMNGTLSPAEFALLQSQDIAMLRRFEQARDLTVTLIKRWLAEYKFRDWTTHQTSPDKLGQPVTNEEKVARAEEIARLLGDNGYWHSHGRMIGINSVRNLLKLKVDDYSTDAQLRDMIRSYNDLMTDYIARSQLPYFLHSRHHF
jgi:membrane-bound ClpP family serine protease